MSELYKETTDSREVKHGVTEVGLIPVRLSELEFRPFARGILVQAAPDNTVPVWVGSENVSTNSGRKPGFPLFPGAYLTLPLNQPNNVWLVADDLSQHVAWIGA